MVYGMAVYCLYSHVMHWLTVQYRCLTAIYGRLTVDWVWVLWWVVVQWVALCESRCESSSCHGCTVSRCVVSCTVWVVPWVVLVLCHCMPCVVLALCCCTLHVVVVPAHKTWSVNCEKRKKTWQLTIVTGCQHIALLWRPWRGLYWCRVPAQITC